MNIFGQEPFIQHLHTLVVHVKLIHIIQNNFEEGLNAYNIELQSDKWEIKTLLLNC